MISQLIFAQGTVYLLVTRSGQDIFLQSFRSQHEQNLKTEKAFFSSALKMQQGDQLMVLFSGTAGSGGYTLSIKDLVVLVRYSQ